MAVIACGRFAPSPSGRLHFGSLVAALGSWLFARSRGARWIVRIDDLDRERERPGSADDIIATLAAFGFESDLPVVRQSKRTRHYQTALTRLRENGLAYPCWCSRSDLQGHLGIHPAACVAQRRDHERAPTWRVRTRGTTIAFDDALQGRHQQDVSREVGDFVIWRADGVCAYQLAAVVDDAEYGVDLVVRGADLLDSTPRQMLLQRLLGYPTPAYAHLPLAVGLDGRKLSKHDGALAVDRHDPLPTLRAALAFLGQHVPAMDDVHSTLREATADFRPERIPMAVASPAAVAAAQKDVCDSGGQNQA